MSNDMIDMSLYDRQIRTYGKEAVEKMASSSVLIYGLAGGLGTEVGKNLALGGIRNIYLFDSNQVTKKDLETGYYYTEESLRTKRSQALKFKLQELNPYVSIESVENYQMNQNVTILINQPTNIVNKVNKYARENDSKIVVLYSNGLSGVVFVDAGERHIILDQTGEHIESVQIANITKDGLVTCAPNNGHDFQSGDLISFSNMEGTNLEQLNKMWRIKVNNKTSFQLVDFVNIMDFNFINGTANHNKESIEILHKPFNNQMERNISYTFDMEHANNLIDMYLEMFSNKPITKLLELARLSSFELIPVVSIMGSISASEVIKLVTNRYMPANQWFTWSDMTLLPKDVSNNEDCKTSYGMIYGSEFETKLLNSEWLMVGSGAIGCEHLKNLAFMGVTNIHLTDPDSIEKSNLNRQFLFRSHHIGKPKSLMASEAIKNMKSNMNIKSYTEKVGSDNTQFTNNLMPRITGVLNALDNVKARRFMDEQCFKFGKPLFESGTTGTKGNTQPVIPFVTETYSATSDPDNEKTFPMCTIKSFPNEIAHTIHWAMDNFEFFNRAPSTMNRWIENNMVLDSMSQIERTIGMQDINMFTIKYRTQHDVNMCAKWAVDMFTENYYNSIIQLLHTFPIDHEVSPGVKFWSAGKRCPKPIQFDINNNMHMDYIETTFHILASVSGLEDNYNRNQIKHMIQDYKPEEFKPKDVKNASNDNEVKNDMVIEQVVIGNPDDFKPTYVSLEFEKDDHKHISWITAASNLRAMNYGIPIEDKQKTKGIAGRIIPAIATTTSIVSGLILLEMVKYLLGYNKVDTYRSTFVNLATPLLVYSDPIEAPTISVAGVKMNSWTKFEYTTNTTLQEFKEYYENMFKTNITMIVIGSAMIYAEFMGNSDNLDKKLSQLICETLEVETVPQNTTFVLATEDEENEIPPINVNFF
jgi:ubiquitin-activating enzyme E1